MAPYKKTCIYCGMIWTECTVIFRAFSLPGNTVRLARESSCNNVNCSTLLSNVTPGQLLNIGPNRYIWPVLV